MGVYKMRKLILIVGLFFIGCDTPAEKNKKEIAKNTQKIENIQMQIETNKEKLESLKTEINSIKQQLKNKNSNNLNNKIVKIETQINQLNKKINKNKECLDYIVINPTTFITIHKSNVYEKPDKNSTIVKIWDVKTTFTSYKEKNNFVKVTGYFVHDKWIENKKSWWIDKNDIAIKRLNND